MSAHFAVKQALFHEAGGVFRFLQFLQFVHNASYGIWVKEFPRFLGTFKQTEGCDINTDRAFWVLLFFGISYITQLNSLSREDNIYTIIYTIIKNIINNIILFIYL